MRDFDDFKNDFENRQSPYDSPYQSPYQSPYADNQNFVPQKNEPIDSIGEGTQNNQQYPQYPQYDYGYNQYPNQPYGVYMPQQPDKKYKNAAITSLVLGIVSAVMSIVCCCFAVPIVAIIPAIISIVFYSKSQNEQQRYTEATVGLVFAIIGIVLSAIATIFIVFTLLSPDFKEVLREWEKELEESGYELERQYGFIRGFFK